jgi:hypothetical protein
MDNKKTFLVAVFASIAIAAFATPGGPGTGSRRSAFSSPNDPFHDTYKKNTGQIRREAPKPVNNLHAKISAARAEAIKFELERERARQSPISCWSNFGTLSTVAVAQSAPATVGQKSITIVNSNVTINQ